MSGFDDLLKQSSRALEENPFEDPFANNRSNSPDPWSSYNHPSSAFDYGASAFDDVSAATPTAESHHDAFGALPAESHSFNVPVAPSDPLDSANLPPDDEPEPIAKPWISPKSPGFRESVETEHPPLVPEPLAEHSVSDEPLAEPVLPRAATPPLPSSSTPLVATPVLSFSPSTPISSLPAEPEAPAGPPSPAPPSSARLPQRQHASHPSGQFSFGNSSPTISESQRAAISSPLDQPPVTSFASLALGGESFNGWDGAQSAFVGTTTLPSSTQDEDDDDDDKPLRPRPASPAASAKKDTGLQPLFTITVDDPQKVGDPIRGYTMYTVHTRTTSPLYSKPTFSVLRRYSDFLWLYETLSLNNPGVVVPPVPEKSPFGRFDDQFVQQRRTGLENCINKMANHPVLCKDADLKLFLESDTFSLDIKHRKAEIANERGGLMASIGQSITGPRFIETDEWFDRQKAHLDILESQLRGLVKAIDVVSRHRNELAVAVGDFAQAISDLAASDLGKSLSHSLGALEELERKAQESESAQARADQATLLSTADEYTRLVNSVRMAFSSRVRVYHAWQAADADLRRIKQTHERNRAQGKVASDRLGHTYSQIGEAERRALDAKQEFEQVSRLVKSEVARFEAERVDDFKKSLEGLLDGMITRQKEIIQEREAFQQLLLKKIPGPGINGATLTSTA